jgi:hypothetical protein
VRCSSHAQGHACTLLRPLAVAAISGVRQAWRFGLIWPQFGILWLCLQMLFLGSPDASTAAQHLSLAAQQAAEATSMADIVQRRKHGRPALQLPARVRVCLHHLRMM